MCFRRRGHQSRGAFSAFSRNELILLFFHDRRFLTNTNQHLCLKKNISPTKLQMKLPLVLGGPEPPEVLDLPVRLKQELSTGNIFIVKMTGLF